MRRPSPHHRKTDPLEGLRQVHDQATAPNSSSPARYFEPLHFHQIVPNCSLSSSISASVASESIRYLCCHFATSGALIASHQRINIGMSGICLSHITLFGTKKNIVVQACCGLSNSVPPSPRVPPLLLLFLLSRPGGVLPKSTWEDVRLLMDFFRLDSLRRQTRRLTLQYSKVGQALNASNSKISKDFLHKNIRGILQAETSGLTSSEFASVLATRHNKR